LFFAPLITIIISSLRPEDIATAMGMSNFFRILGGSFGTSLSVTLWDRREAFHHSRLVEHINPYNPILTNTLNTLNTNGFPSPDSLEQTSRLLTNQSFMLATNDIFWLSGSIFFLLIFAIWFAKPPFFIKKGAAVAE
jgi:DHA2 family multidrug resistance protein